MVRLSHLLLFSIFCFAATWAAIIQNRANRAEYDMYGNYKPTEFHKYSTDCCIVPECDLYRNCMDTLKCDHTCSQGNYRKADYGSTPGYRLKESYSQYDCRFGECNYFKFTCKHCPSPYERDFSIYTVRKDCFNCYELY